MTDFENRIWDILNSEDADHVKIGKIRKLYTPNIDPTACKNDRIYYIVVDEGFVDPYETIGWRGSGKPPQWCWIKPDDITSWGNDNDVTVLGEYHPEDEYVDRVYDRIEDAVADGMGRYTVLEDRNGSKWTLDSVTTYGTFVTTDGQFVKDYCAPFTVLHWVPKEAGE